MKDDRTWVPDGVDIDWIESIAQPIPPAAAAIEAAAEPLDVPDRRPPHRACPGRARRRAPPDRRGRHGLRELHAVARPRPAGRRDARHHRPGHGADRHRPWLLAGGRDRRRADRPGQRPGAGGVRGGRPAPGRPLRPRVHRCPQARIRRLPRRAHRRRATGRRRARRRRQRAVERPRRALDARYRRRRPQHGGAPRVLRAGRGGSTLHLVDPAPRRRPAPGLVARRRRVSDPRPIVRHPARARRHPGSPPGPGHAGHGRRRVDGARRALPDPRAGPRQRALRAQRGLRRSGHGPGRRRRGRGHPARVRRRRRARAWWRRRASWRSARRRWRPPSSASSSTGWRATRTEPRSGSSAGPGPRPAPRRRVRRRRRLAMPGVRSRGLSYEAHESMAIAVLADHRRRDRRPLRRRAAGHRPSHRRRPAGRGEHRGRGRGRASRRRLRRRPLRHRRDEGASPDLEGRTLPRRSCLDRPSRPHGPRGTGSDDRPMRIYISVDMEGIGGISHPHPTDPKDPRYPTSVALMVGETNAAIDGALAAGATDILVNDSHWNMYNLLPEDLHRSARVLQGEKAWSMVAGAQPDPDGSPAFDVALFIGYHARAGHGRGTIAHTYSGRPIETRLAGRPTGEYGLNALVLGAWGIPVGLVAGDDALAEEVEAWLPWAERVVVKVADGTHSAISVHPEVARERIRAARRRRCGARRWAPTDRSRSTAGRHRGRLRARRGGRPRCGRPRRGADRRSHGPLQQRRPGARLPRLPRHQPAGGGGRLMARRGAAKGPDDRRPSALDRLAERAETLAGAWAPEPGRRRRSARSGRSCACSG